MNNKRWWFRMALLCELVEKSPVTPGRTVLMKLAYFLQTVKDVPLDYDFRLYTYGPFDSDLLDDLAQAESLGAIKSQVVSFNNGYGYEFRVGPNPEFVRTQGAEQLANHGDAIRWVVDEFSRCSAADLELLSTIVYADREAAALRKETTFPDLARQVREIKPRFPEPYIMDKIRELATKGLLKAARVGK